MKVVEIVTPIKLVSESNLREHWFIKHKRRKEYFKALKLVLPSEGILLPCEIHLVRVGKRELDSDNLQSAFKSIRDFIGDYLIPGKRMGLADNDPRLSWKYSQEKGSYCIKIIFKFEDT